MRAFTSSSIILILIVSGSSFADEQHASRELQLKAIIGAWKNAAVYSYSDNKHKEVLFERLVKGARSPALDAQAEILIGISVQNDRERPGRFLVVDLSPVKPEGVKNNMDLKGSIHVIMPEENSIFIAELEREVAMRDIFRLAGTASGEN